MKSICKIIILSIACLSLFFLNTCKDEAPTSPCIDCPFDFRLIDFEPAWSPDGLTIAYVHGDTALGKTGIYLINPDGTNKILWYSSMGASAPSWSPDGQWIAFYDSAQIFKRKLNGDSLIQLTNDGRNFFPDWSPDGLWITYDSDLNDNNGSNLIWIMKNDGSYKRDVSVHGMGEWRMPNWSPNGLQIVHQRYIGEGAPEIFTMDTSGDNPVRLTYNQYFDSYPKYSPNGMRIAFTSQPNGGIPQIWIVNADGTNLKQLTTTQGYTCDWSPDGEWIVYTDSRAVDGHLWIMRINGSEKHQLTFY
jgi:TolB protein